MSLSNEALFMVFFLPREGGNNLSLAKKKQLVCKPGSVPHKSRVPVIYLSLLSPTGFIGPPSGIGRAALIAPVYMTFQLPRSTALMSPQDW